METKQPHKLPHSPAYNFLLQAGPRLYLLHQVHAHIIVSGYGRSRSLLTKLLNLACAAGSISYTRQIFLAVPNPDSFLFTSLIKSTSKFHNFSIYSLYFYSRMVLSNVSPSNYTFTSVIKSCADLSALKHGRVVHGHVLVHGFGLDVYVQAALVALYGKCGDLINARKVFDKTRERSIVAWNSMISGYEQNGFAKEAIGLFDRMKETGVEPDSATFVSVLSACAHLGAFSLGCWVHEYIVGNGLDLNVVLACAHAGLVNEGRRLFASIREEYHLVPGVEHRVCLVDMLGRAGLLDEAYNFIKEEIPENPAPAILTAMLGACKMHKNFDLGAQVAEHLLATEPENPAHYVILSNIYALAGRMDQVEIVRNDMIRKCLKKQVGYSTIEVDQNTYLFSMGDRSHSETNAIYHYLDELMWKCREAGYVPVSDSVMHELEEEEREYALRYHTVSSREIIVRDKLRFHHFKTHRDSIGQQESHHIVTGKSRNKYEGHRLFILSQDPVQLDMDRLPCRHGG
ncbi:hypothetical protein D5086_022272 [Populus alba]|uniref:Uncharacterized protein n=1 Tax=Populus alba TaxID=43335 RepID=A0ACC4BEJ0_POPAL